MTVGRAFRKLTRLVRRLERSDWTVVAVEPIPGPAFEPDDPIAVSVRCSRRTGPDPKEGPRGVGRNGSHGAPPEVVAEVRELSTDVSVSPDRVQVAPGGTTVLDLTVEIRLEHDDDDHDTGTADGSANENGRLPLHRDRTRLWRLYEEHDTFGEMADAVDRSVSEETIRRYMIEHGIHDPGAAANGHDPRTNGHAQTNGDDGALVRLRAVDEQALVDALVEAKTVREVSNRLDLDREATVSILSELDLLDHVMGPLRDAPERSVTEAEIRERLATVHPTIS